MLGKREFWRRQFLGPATWGQKCFDVVFGILAPVVCVVADPIVFKTSGSLTTPWISYATGAYVFIALEILTLSAWLFIPRKGPLPTLALAGPLLAGALASACLGLRMLPLSLIGLMVFIGILGFTPFVTGFVFLRNGLRAWRSLGEEHRSEFHRGIAVFFAFFTMAVAVGGQWTSDRSMAALVADPDSPRARQVVRWLGTGSQADDLVAAWEKETDPIRKERLAKTYREVTGRDVEDRQQTLRN